MYVSFFAFVGVLANVTFGTNNAQAASCDPGRAYCNNDEKRAYDTCRGNPPARQWIQGAIWFNNTGDALTTDGYYALGVNVAPNADYVDVTIRGSVYGCTYGNQQSGNIWAIGIESRNPNANLLTIIDRKLDRGQWTGIGNQWTRKSTGPESSARARLDVRNLATNNVGSADSQTINIGLYRCQSKDGNRVTGTCDTAIVPVTVNRAQRPSYDLTPIVNVNPTASEAGQNIAVTPSVRTSPGGSVNNVTWQLTKFTVRPGGAYTNTQTENTRTPLVHYGNGTTTVAQGTGNFSGTRVLPVSTDVAEDLPVGSLQCYALSVNPYTTRSGVTGWRHGVPACTVIAKKPRVQVLGGDLIVGRATATNPAKVSNVTTSTKLVSATGLHYGAWAEYAIIPSGVVMGMGSGSAFASGANTNAICSVSVLTFANNTGTSCNPNRVGQYEIKSSAPNVAARFIANAPAPIPGASVNLNTLVPSLIYNAAQANLNVTSSAAFGPGRWVVINAPSTTVTISSNLNYTNAPLTGIGSIPQIVIIANNIIIADNVTNVDAWLVATGSGTNGIVNTCGAGGVTQTTLPTAAQCNQKLTVNGPLMANHLLMRRTAGAGTATQSGDPGEVFNLRADAYVWSSAYSPGTGRIPTANTKELPPRF
jgi:hypothetical protein